MAWPWGWGATKPNVSHTRTPLHGSPGAGGRTRRSPVGGAAYGMPRNTTRSSFSTPWSEPSLVSTTTDISGPPGLLGTFEHQPRSPDLAGVVPHRAVAAFEASGDLVGDEALLEELAQLVVGHRCAGHQLEDGVHPLAEVLVRQADHGAGVDGRVLVEGGLDLGRVDVGSAGQDHVGAPVGKVQVP